MFDLSFSELLIVAIVAIVVIGPKELPSAMANVGRWVGRARAVARNFRSGFDAMVREAELKELEKEWADQNARIMAEHPMEPLPDTVPDDTAHPALPFEEGAPDPQRADSDAPPEGKPKP